MALTMNKFDCGDVVEKLRGDYIYKGTVVGVIWKLSGELRYVVEDDRGLLFIFNENSLEKVK